MKEPADCVSGSSAVLSPWVASGKGSRTAQWDLFNKATNSKDVSLPHVPITSLKSHVCVCVCVFHGMHVEIREQPQMLVLTFHLVCDRISSLFSACFRLVVHKFLKIPLTPLPISLWEDCGLQTHILPALLLCRFWGFEVRSLYVCDKQFYL